MKPKTRFMKMYYKLPEKARDENNDWTTSVFEIVEYPLDWFFHCTEIQEQILGETIESFLEER